MAAVVAIAAPLLLFAFAAILQSPVGVIEEASARGAPEHPASPHASYGDSSTSNTSSMFSSSPGPGGGSPAKNSPATELLLAEVLRRCDAHQATFLGHRQLVAAFIAEAVAHLATLSPLLADVSGHSDGSAFEGTRIADSSDFDTYALISADALLRRFDVRRGAEGRIAARLRRSDDRGALPTELLRMVTREGYLDARWFKQWAFGCLEEALRRAARAHPRLRSVVYSTHGAAGVNLTAADGTLLQVDLAVTLAPPPIEGVLRAEALRPCGLTLVAPSRAAPWAVYSSVDLTLPPPTPGPVTSVTTGTTATTATSFTTAATSTTAADQRWFVVDTVQLEHDLLTAQPLLRDVIRLLKWLSSTLCWDERLHVNSFALKQSVYWTFAESCAQDAWGLDSAKRGNGDGAGLLPPAVAALRTFEQALRRGRMDQFFVGEPAGNVLGSVTGGRPAMRDLADEVREVIDTLLGGNQETIRSLLHLGKEHKAVS